MKVMLACSQTQLSQLFISLQKLLPGILACSTVALASQFLSEHYGAPALLIALLLGMAFHFLAEDGRCVCGIVFSSKTILQIAVTLLGARISMALLLDLGLPFIGLVVAAVISTIIFGLACARMLGRGWRLALVTGGSVAICGASAAAAIAAVLPKNEHSERNLTFTVMSVTILSSIAMITYPTIVQMLDLDNSMSGVFLGGSIHDVAQVVGAGFSISDDVGDIATLVKLIRVTMLAPIVLILSVALWHLQRYGETTKRPPLLPKFIVGFLALVVLSSFGLLPQSVISGASIGSKWGLLIAIAAVGMKTSLKNIQNIGRTAIILIIAETCFIAILVLGGIQLLA